MFTRSLVYSLQYHKFKCFDVRVYTLEPCAARILMDINSFTSFKYLQCLVFQSSPVSWGAGRAGEFK